MTNRHISLDRLLRIPRSPACCCPDRGRSYVHRTSAGLCDTCSIALLLVCLLDVFLHLRPCHTLFLKTTLYAIIKWCMDEDADNIRIVSQNEIRTSPDDNIRFLFCKFFQNLCLIVEKIVRWCKIITIRRNHFHLCRLSWWPGSEMCFCGVHPDCRTSADSDHCHQKPYAKSHGRNSRCQIFGQHLTNGLTAAAVLSCNCNDSVAAHKTPPSEMPLFA